MAASAKEAGLDGAGEPRDDRNIPTIPKFRGAAAPDRCPV